MGGGGRPHREAWDWRLASTSRSANSWQCLPRSGIEPYLPKHACNVTPGVFIVLRVGWQVGGCGGGVDGGTSELLPQSTAMSVQVKASMPPSETDWIAARRRTSGRRR